MLPKVKKELKEYIEKYYWKNKQCLNITTFEVMDKHSSMLDICLADPETGYGDKYLFEIWNYNAFIDHEHIGNSWSKYYKWYETWDSSRALSQPYYMNRVFCLPKFKGITEDDIMRAVKKFIKEELGCWLIFNFKFIKGKP